MSYSIESAKLLAKQLRGLVSLNRHQFAGEAANLDFWLHEIRHCLMTVDGYCERFDKMRTAQERYALEHGTVEFEYWDPVDTTTSASPPRKVLDGELKDARRELRAATDRFLTRCSDESLIDRKVFEDARVSIA